MGGLEEASEHGPSAEDEAVFEYLIAEYGEPGGRAVGFLRTAIALLQLPSKEAERLAEAAAYCLREAMTGIPKAAAHEEGDWREAWRGVEDATRRFEIARGMPGEDQQVALGSLLRAIGEMEDYFRRDKLHQRRLIALMVQRTGAGPLKLSPDPIREFQDLMETLNGALHGSTSPQDARGYLDRCLALMAQLFTPPDVRLPRLDELAAKADPDDEDVDLLSRLMSSHQHLDYFLRKVVSPRWLILLGSRGVLDPPDGPGRWPVSRTVERLGENHSGELAEWFETMIPSWTKSDVQTAYVGEAVRLLGSSGHRQLLRLVREHPGLNFVCLQICLAIDAATPSDEFVMQAADTLLNPGVNVTRHELRRYVLPPLVHGMTPENRDDRLGLLVHKVSAVPEDDPERRHRVLMRHGSIADADPYPDYAEHFEIVLEGLVRGIRRARETGAPTKAILDALDPIPEDLRPRLRVWVLSESEDLEVDDLQGEVASAIPQRHATGDDAALIERICAIAAPEDFEAAWRSSLPPPPESDAVAAALAGDRVPELWWSIRSWYPLLPDSVRSSWDTAVTLLNAAYGPSSREAYIRPDERFELEVGTSPMLPGDLAALPPNEAAERIAAWRPDSAQPMVIARELGRALEEVVAQNSSLWARDPVRTVGLLRHPTYIHHYFQGLARIDEGLAGFGPHLVEAVSVTRAHPWNVISLGDDSFDFDPDWRGADDAGVHVLKRLAERDVDLGTRRDEAWHLLVDAARDRSEVSWVGGREDPLQTAINRAPTRALEAVIAFMASDYRLVGLVRQDGLELLDEVLHLTDRDGAEHRAIIAPRLPFLRHIAPLWTDEHRGILFGEKAPDGLGQQTLDLALKWGQANRWLLETCRAGVLDAARREVPNSMAHLLIGMLWGLPGFSIDAIVRDLVALGPSRLSSAGESLARLLRGTEVSGEHVSAGIAFWEKVLDSNVPTNGLYGFGWWAEVEQIQREVWEQLMLRTAEAAGGTLDWCEQVAERAVRPTLTALGLLILASLVRGAHEPWERSSVGHTGVDALRASQGREDLAEARSRLRTALLETGFFDAQGL